MHGERPRCLFLVFSNPGAGGDEALERWYMEVHGPDAFSGGTFTALHRYQAVGDYDARFVAIWEGGFGSKEEARAQMVPGSSRLKAQGRITDDLKVVWSDMHFRSGDDKDSRAPIEVGTLTLVEGGDGPVPEDPATVSYHYGDLVLSESPDGPEAVAARWAGRGQAGMAPHGPYRNMFDAPEGFLADRDAMAERWVSHWRPIGSLRAAEVGR